MLTRIRNRVMDTSEVYDVLLNEISICETNENPVPRKKRPAKIPEMRAGLKPATISFLRKIARRPSARITPKGTKTRRGLCPSHR